MLADPHHPRSLREIPNFRIMAFKVVRGTGGGCSAITLPVSRRARYTSIASLGLYSEERPDKERSSAPPATVGGGAFFNCSSWS